MVSFLKDLSIRRRSRASFKTTPPETENGASEKSSSNDGETTERGTVNQSSTTVDSSADRSSPPSTLGSIRSRSSTNLSNLFSKSNGGSKRPQGPGQGQGQGHRPRMPSSHSSRYSLVGMPAQNAENNPRPTPSTSPHAPRVTSISDGSWVHQKVLLISGEAADTNHPIDGNLTVFHHQDGFPPVNWPVNDSHFKAIIYLQPGPNRLRLEFTSPKLQNQGGQAQSHSSWININFLPLVATPPLQLCILVAKDSPGTFDAMPDRKAKEGNGLDIAIRKFRMAAYLWQVFTAEQMNRNGFGRRIYRYEEEWQPGTLSYHDRASGAMRNEAKIHVITLNKTVAEIQDLDIAQQYKPAQHKGKLYDIAIHAVNQYFGPKSAQKRYVSCMFLDSHWDKQVGTIRGHAALGGGGGNLQLAIFGSHCLQSYPSNLEEVVPAFNDCTRTDTDFVANDCGESGSSWEAANIGIGAHLHETGHLLGCPHQANGIMLRGYVKLNRTFMTREAYSTRTKQPGLRLVRQEDETHWHRLDVLRFRLHPCFQLPTDTTATPPSSDTSVQVWSVESGAVVVTAATGIAWVQFKPESDDGCKHWIEYLDPTTGPAGSPRQVNLSESLLNEHLPPKKRNEKLKVKIFACGGGEHTIADFHRFAGKESRLKLPDGRPGFKGFKLGHSAMKNSSHQQVFLLSSMKSPKLMKSVRVFSGQNLDGIEFVYEDGEAELFGKKGGGRPGNFGLDVQRGETIVGFYLRAGAWIDGIQILTSTGRRSAVFGNGNGGSGHMLIPPRGYTLAGIYGSCGGWVDGFGLIIAR